MHTRALMRDLFPLRRSDKYLYIMPTLSEPRDDPSQVLSQSTREVRLCHKFRC